MKHSHVLVSGASRGIGAAIALELARQGIVVGCLSRSGVLPDFAGEATSLHTRLLPIATDVTDPAVFAEAVAEFIDKTGHKPSGLINNAGIHTACPSHRLSADDFRQVMDANALSVLFGCQAIYPFLLEIGGGLIINIGSFYDRLGIKQNIAYCASKAAVGAITRCLAVEWAKHGIRVLNVAPGYIKTDINREAIEHGPLGEFLAKRIPRSEPGEPDEVAKLVAGLFAMDSGFLTGETIYIDGGQSITD
ncbi:MAG: SDR family oxidoreductase [Burkholderiaceae bacterium]|nr:SDR family oxidoreductase [Burkholderiaceae bacterium]